MAVGVEPAPVTVSMTSATSLRKDGAAAVRELAAALGDPADLALVLVFVAPGNDLDRLGDELRRWCGDRVVACTSAGNIGAGGYQDDGIVAIGLSGGGMCSRTVHLDAGIDVVDTVCRAGPELVALRAMRELGDVFGILLVDGPPAQQDRLAATLRVLLGDVPIVGGSAGDDLSFSRTAVYADGRFRPNTATFTMVATRAPFRIVRLQHHEPTGTLLVATEAIPEERLLTEINGRFACDVYAEAAGVKVSELNSSVFSAHPMVLTGAGEHWIRSVAAARMDGSLRLFTAVDRGDVLRLGRPAGLLDNLERRLTLLDDDGGTAGVLAFDCVLRRIEARATGLEEAVNDCLSRHRVAGLSTYGEQFNGMNVNHTMAAVAFAGARPPGTDQPGAHHDDGK